MSLLNDFIIPRLLNLLGTQSTINNQQKSGA